jgi:hypothetical protein
MPTGQEMTRGNILYSFLSNAPHSAQICSNLHWISNHTRKPKPIPPVKITSFPLAWAQHRCTRMRFSLSADDASRLPLQARGHDNSVSALLWRKETGKGMEQGEEVSLPSPGLFSIRGREKGEFPNEIQ